MSKKTNTPNLICPNCGYKFNTYPYNMSVSSLQTAIGDLLNLKHLKQERNDGTHYYHAITNSKPGLISMLEAIIKLKGLK